MTDMSSSSKQIHIAKVVCENKVLDAIHEFEQATGLPVSCIEYHNENMVKNYVTIVISL